MLLGPSRCWEGLLVCRVGRRGRSRRAAEGSTCVLSDDRVRHHPASGGMVDEGSPATPCVAGPEGTAAENHYKTPRKFRTALAVRGPQSPQTSQNAQRPEGTTPTITCQAQGQRFESLARA